MLDLIEILREGTLLKKGEAPKVIDHILSHPEDLQIVIDGMSHEDAGIRMRSLYCAEQICRKHPEWIQAYKAEMIASLDYWEQYPEMAQLLPLLLSHLVLEGQELDLALEFVRRRLKQSKKTFEQVNCLQALTDHASRNTWLIDELLATFDEYEVRGGAAINARIRKLRKKLAKLG